jgi:hypothetical protein
MTRREKLFVLFAMLAGTAILASGLFRGWTTDEVALVQPWSISRIFWDPESAVNPPLQRIILNTFFSSAHVLAAGRVISLLCAIAAVWCSFVTSRRLAGVRAGLLAIAMVVLNPVVVASATEARSYAMWLAVACLHVAAIVGCLQSEQRMSTPTKAIVSATCALLPWIHFLSIPVLASEVGVLAILFPERRRELLTWAGAPLCLAVVAALPLLFGDPSRRVASGVSQLIPTIGNMLSGGWPVGGVLVVPLLIVAARARSETPQLRRYLLMATVGAIVSAILIGLRALVRPPAAMMLLPWFVPLIVISIRRASAPVVGALLLLGVVGIGVGWRTTVEDRMKWFAGHLHELDVHHDDRPWVVDPVAAFPALYYTFEHDTLPNRAPSCPRGCFQHEGTTFLERQGAPLGGESLFVSFDTRTVAPRDCKLATEHDGLRVFECPPGAQGE